MMDVRWFIEPATLPSGMTCIEAVPGVGNVGKLVADAAIETDGAERIAQLFHPEMPPHATINEQGLVEPPHLALWRVPQEQDDLLVLAGSAQPLTPAGQYEMALAILDLLGELGCGRLLVLAGLAAEAGDERVFGVFADQAQADQHPEIPGPEIEASSGILGLAGLLVSLGPWRGLETVCTVAASPGSSLDPAAAARLAIALEAWFGVTVPFDGDVLERLAAKLEAHGDGLTDLPSSEDLHFYQ